MAGRATRPGGQRGPAARLGPWLLLLAALVGGFLLFQSSSQQPEVAESRTAAPTGHSDPRPEARLSADPQQWPPGTRVIPYGAGDSRTVEINRTLDLIEAGGPFPYYTDGYVFENRERRLPPGSYREYTVITPHAEDRGARRVVLALPSGVAWYSDDHYETFAPVARVRLPR